MENVFDVNKRNDLFYIILSRLDGIDKTNLKDETPLGESELYKLKKSKLEELFAEVELSAKSVDLEELYPAIDWATEKKMKFAFQSWCFAEGLESTVHELQVYGTSKGTKLEIRIKTSVPAKFYRGIELNTEIKRLFEAIANQEVNIELNSSNPFG